MNIMDQTLVIVEMATDTTCTSWNSAVHGFSLVKCATNASGAASDGMRERLGFRAPEASADGWKLVDYRRITRAKS